MGLRGQAAPNVKATLHRFAVDPGTHRQLAFYAAIGVLAVTLDLVVFRWLIALNWIAELAAIASGAASMVLHFSLNKYIAFKNHDRPLRDQLGTYCAVVTVWWIVTLTVVAVATRLFLAPPLVAKIVAIAINFPLGFVAQRQLTFGAGIAAALLRRNAPS